MDQPLYQPSALKKYLQELGISPKKRLSQNFLLDGNIIKKMIALADLKVEDTVLEIGPGPGALTEALLEKGAAVIAVEKDPVLAKGLQRLEKAYQGKLVVYCADMLTIPLEELFPDTLQSRAKVIANLPYHVATPIVALLAPKHHLFSSLVVMVQEELAQRYTAQPSTKHYSSFTLFLSYYTSPQYGFRVSRHCFFPKPKVESAVMRCDLKIPPRLSDEKAFFHLVRTAFGQRRKMLRSSLASLYSHYLIEESLSSIGKSPKSRPEELLLEEFISFFETLSKKYKQVLPPKILETDASQNSDANIPPN